MEKPPVNKIEDKEGNIEKFPTKEQVLEYILNVLENGEVVREENDEKGLYLLDVQATQNQEGKVYSYEYLRRGRYDNINSGALETKIVLVIYEDGIPIGGDDFAKFDENTGEWKLL